MTASNPDAFTYPTAKLHRRHGPSGYSDYESYRPWLRDEFSFRCVYCLLRERWSRVFGEFDLDHFIPQACDESLSTDYGNLIYSCHACNTKKGSVALPNAELYLTADSVRISPSGQLIPSTPEVERLIDVLALNSPRWVQWRLSWIRIVELAAERDSELYQRLMGFPDDLPDLARSKPPHNSRPDGIEESCFARRERGELPATYIT